MAGRDEPPGPDPDDWFDEPRVPPERRPRVPADQDQTAVDDWLTGEDLDRGGGFRVGGQELTRRQAAAAVGVLALVVLLIGLAAGGVFSSSNSSTATTSTAPAPAPATTAGGSTQPAPSTVVKGPTTTLKPGDTGAQVVALQRALAKLGHSPGKPDGTYGPATQQAVVAFQKANNLTADGIFGTQTLAALTSALQRTG
ncbi:MAG: peptidoglycan-binding protein [Actinobacteria bacterium]|nr:MAG: peptidoglycan-binding protein [Actinomycetota bacterium]